MVEFDNDLQPLFDNPVRSPPLDVGNKAAPAGIVLKRRVIKPLLGRTLITFFGEAMFIFGKCFEKCIECFFRIMYRLIKTILLYA
jgi:hypothetical protein